ncbi:eotaxin-like [Hippocampus zosterae]|uniref:eotaxin-like n=1 Tax=Hippocampus zosterae TaxID=109293 RepID=UPI00223CBF7C|nr:eotaxin-like [Hippocampus zosterae]
MKLNLILLCWSLWMTSALTTHGPVSDCCPGLSNTTVSLNRIKSYVIQSVGACSFKAVVFYTHGRKRICADPNSCWTQRAMFKVDGRALRRKEESNDKSTGASGTTVPCTLSRNSHGRKRRRGKLLGMKKGKTRV